MRRRGLTRTVALVTLVSMLSCEFTTYATTNAGIGQDETTTQETTADDATTLDTTGTATGTNADSSESAEEEYVNERLEKNYSHVSKEYTYKNYTGSDVTIPAREAYDSINSTGILKKGTFGYI